MNIEDIHADHDIVHSAQHVKSPRAELHVTQLPLHLANHNLAGKVLFETLGLDPKDLNSLNEQEGAELRKALKDAGVRLGDLVKIRLWMQSAPARPLGALARMMDEPPAVRKRLQASGAMAEKSDGGVSAECAAAFRALFTCSCRIIFRGLSVLR
jgi:hypothetical protein